MRLESKKGEKPAGELKALLNVLMSNNRHLRNEGWVALLEPGAPGMCAIWQIGMIALS